MITHKGTKSEGEGEKCELWESCYFCLQALVPHPGPEPFLGTGWLAYPGTHLRAPGCFLPGDTFPWQWYLSCPLTYPDKCMLG